MAQVNVSINGRQYRMACDDGQEDHLTRLAQDLDRRIARLRDDFGQIGDMRLTIMAALTLADELSDHGQRLRRAEEEGTGLRNARTNAVAHAKATEAAIIKAFNSAAERIENLARALDTQAATDRARD